MSTIPGLGINDEFMTCGVYEATHLSMSIPTSLKFCRGQKHTRYYRSILTPALTLVIWLAVWRSW